MEDVHAAARAYYEHGTDELKSLAQSFFVSMDSDNDGKISCSEFEVFLRESGYSWITRDRDLFARLDRNGDRHLDFQEVLTLYYIIKTTNIWCQGQNCGAHLTGMYFTCVRCFDAPQQGTFDLCGACYGNFNFDHHHNCFLDNHVLLRSKRGLSAAATNLTLAIYTPPETTPPATYNYPVTYNYQSTYNYHLVVPCNHPPPPARPSRTKWFQLEAAIQAAIAGANLAGTFCTIM